jgi:primosomal protein N' (replication factor Y)
MIATVVLRDSVRRTDREYDYFIPTGLEEQVLPGQYVRVPFGGGNRTEVALIISVAGKSEFSNRLKSIIEIVDPLPVLRDDQIGMISKIRSRYSCTHGDAVRLMVPSVVSDHKAKTHKIACVCDEERAISVLSENELSSLAQIRVLELLLEAGEIPVTEIMNALSVSRSPIRTLEERGLIEICTRKSIETCETDEVCEDETEISKVPTLTQNQKTAIDYIMSESSPGECLLFGVTGSGKTEVYLRCAQEIVADGGSVIFLVPEISLTPQMIRWVKERFPDVLAVLHSRLTPRERYEQWNRIRKGEARVVVGARSAVFAPVQNLRMIIVDEEQDTSYKSETHPRYHARDIARMRARITGARLVFGSATPAIETYFSAVTGFTRLLELPERVKEAVMPRVRIVDMRDELIRGNRSLLSVELRSEMSRALERGDQIMLFLNKRGYSSFILCRSCGNTILCPHCSVAMTLHSPRPGRKPILICHSCMFARKVPEACPECGSTLQGKIGIGTQQLEEAVKSAFPESRIIRMDQDTTAGRGAHARLLNAFRNREADILLGTQMIAKGHDFPDVTVVGIMNTDMLVRASDFRAGERAFQLITQASGRAGRGEKRGSVYIQTYQPEDEIILYAAASDYKGFFEKELEYRKRLGYPPFLAFGSLILSNRDEDSGARQASEIKAFLVECADSAPEGLFRIFGPGPAAVYKLRDRYRFQINIKAKNKSALSLLYDKVLARFSDKDYSMHTDIDPY